MLTKPLSPAANQSAADTRSGTEEDLTLVQRAASGDNDAFEEIVNRHSRLVYNVALRSTSSPEDAADISQDVFLKAWRSLSSFRGDCALTTWLCRITLNCCCDHARNSKRHTVLSTTMFEESDTESKTMDIADTDISAMPEEEITRRDEAESVRKAIAELPEDQRNAVILRDINGLSYAEIADSLHLEMGTVKSRINRARAAIKKKLLERNFFP